MNYSQALLSMQAYGATTRLRLSGGTSANATQPLATSGTFAARTRARGKSAWASSKCRAGSCRACNTRPSSLLGRVMQVEPMKPVLQALEYIDLRLRYDGPLSNLLSISTCAATAREKSWLSEQLDGADLSDPKVGLCMFYSRRAPLPKETRAFEEISVDRPTGRSFALHKLITPQIDQFVELRFRRDLTPQFVVVEGLGARSWRYENLC
jgi:hypothetical protein